MKLPIGAYYESIYKAPKRCSSPYKPRNPYRRTERLKHLYPARTSRRASSAAWCKPVKGRYRP